VLVGFTRTIESGLTSHGGLPFRAIARIGLHDLLDELIEGLQPGLRKLMLRQGNTLHVRGPVAKKFGAAPTVLGPGEIKDIRPVALAVDMNIAPALIAVQCEPEFAVSGPRNRFQRFARQSGRLLGHSLEIDALCRVPTRIVSLHRRFPKFQPQRRIANLVGVVHEVIDYDQGSLHGKIRWCTGIRIVENFLPGTGPGTAATGSVGIPIGSNRAISSTCSPPPWPAARCPTPSSDRW